MTAPLCDQCQGALFPCDIASNLTTCVECARRALKAARAHTRAVVVFTSEPPVAPATDIPSARPLGKITPEEWATFTAALSSAARGGEVHQRDMRPLIRGRIESHHIGACYTRAIAMGLIREVRRERSNDVIGRNTNKDEPVYAVGVNAKGMAA